NVPVKIYFIECAVDDCGWGTIKNQPEFNQSMESIANAFSSSLSPEKVFSSGGGEEKIPFLKVYQTTINLKPQVLSVIDSTHEWFYYPVNYIPKEKIFDNYSVNGVFNNLLYKFAWLILIISIIFAIFSPILIFINLFLNKFK
ncbi:MAG: hypothetical protein Q8N63_02480, partial [Nanoarchaeota archaeon]|nr:hypothetical protein [Nanoarchaeota archaeon]